MLSEEICMSLSKLFENCRCSLNSTLLPGIALLVVLSNVLGYAQTDSTVSQDMEYLSEKYYSARTSFDRGDYIEALQQYGDEIGRAHV